MQIRKATIADISALVSLNYEVQEAHARAFPQRFRSGTANEIVAQAFRTSIEAPSAYWLVAEAKQPIGFLSAEFKEREESWCQIAHRACYLAGIAVAAPFRRQGVARALVDQMRREAQVRGVSFVDLDVWAFNQEARAAFSRFGFNRLMERMTLEVVAPNQSREPTHL